MDLQNTWRVLSRHRRIVAAGLLAAVVLATLAVAKPTFDGVTPALAYRDAESWESRSTLYITQEGFPVGTAIPRYRPADDERGLPSVEVGDPNRLAVLTLVYAKLAMGDTIMDEVYSDGYRAGDDVFVEPVPAPPYQSPGTLPLLDIVATSATPERARTLARRTGDEFISYMTEQQSVADIPESDRTVVGVLERPTDSTLVKGRSMTLAVVVFLAVLGMAVAAAFAAENVRQARERAASDERQPQETAPTIDGHAEASSTARLRPPAARRRAAAEPAPEQAESRT